MDLPDNITAGMTELSVDYDIRIDPANVGDHHLWSFGRKTNCDGTANGDYAGSIFGSNTMRLRTGLSATTPTTGASVQRTMTYALREGVWKHLTYTQQRNANGTSWTGVLYEDGVEIGRTTNLSVAPSVNAAGTNCNFLGRSQAPTHYALRGTLRNFRVYDRPLSEDEAIALAEPPGVAGVSDDAAAIDLGLDERDRRRTSTCPRSGRRAARRSRWTTLEPRRGHRERRHHPAGARPARGDRDADRPSDQGPGGRHARHRDHRAGAVRRRRSPSPATPTT